MILGYYVDFYHRFLPIFRTFLGDLVGRFVVLEFYSHDYLSTRLFFFRIRPPEELPHQTCRAFRAEFDSSTLEVSGGLWVIVFEAFRQTLETAA